MMSEQEHRKFLREIDERVLPKREWETDEQYAQRMHDYLNKHDVYAEKYE